MILFDKKAVMKSFYYLMSVDGAITKDEMECFNAIGSELDSENFNAYVDEITGECEAQLHSGIDDEDYYELVLEGIDAELIHQKEDLESGINLRLLIWDMLVIAFSNEEYSSFERKVIKHIVRVFGLEHSIFIEMEQHMKAELAAKSELAWLQKSSRPYNEIRPHIDELEQRVNTIHQAAQNLIADEFYTPIEKIALPSNKVYEKITKVSDTIAVETGKVGKKAAATAENIGKRAKDFFVNKKAKKDSETESLELTDKT